PLSIRSNRSCALLPSSARAWVYRRGAALSRSTAAAGSAWISPCTVLQFSTAYSATSFAAHGGRKGLSRALMIEVTPGTFAPVAGSMYHRAPPRVRVRIAIALLSDLIIYLILRVHSVEARGPWRKILWPAQPRQDERGECAPTCTRSDRRRAFGCGPLFLVTCPQTRKCAGSGEEFSGRC